MLQQFTPSSNSFVPKVQQQEPVTAPPSATSAPSLLSTNAVTASSAPHLGAYQSTGSYNPYSRRHAAQYVNAGANAGYGQHGLGAHHHQAQDGLHGELPPSPMFGELPRHPRRSLASLYMPVNYRNYFHAQVVACHQQLQPDSPLLKYVVIPLIFCYYCVGCTTLYGHDIFDLCCID